MIEPLGDPGQRLCGLRSLAGVPHTSLSASRIPDNYPGLRCREAQRDTHRYNSDDSHAYPSGHRGDDSHAYPSGHRGDDSHAHAVFDTHAYYDAGTNPEGIAADTPVPTTTPEPTATPEPRLPLPLLQLPHQLLQLRQCRQHLLPHRHSLGSRQNPVQFDTEVDVKNADDDHGALPS